MGIVKKQSLQNMISTYAGFGIGAINTILLYPYLLSDNQFGLVSFLLSTANLMMPLMAFGVQNTLIKFYTSFDKDAERGKFTALMLCLPLVVAVLVGLVGTVAYEWISSFLSNKNKEVSGYIWIIFVIGFAMSYFEVFYAWTKVHLQSVYGNFLKEVFPRLCVLLLLAGIFFNWLTVYQFILALSGVYLLRMLLMGLNALSVQRPEMVWGLPHNTSAILKYTTLIILGGSVAVVFLDIDKFMLNQYLDLSNIAYYNVAVYIAVVIAVPARALHQITYPLTSKLMNEGNFKELSALYKKSSINLFVVSGLIFLLIILNIGQLYELLPETYRGGVSVVFLISIAKLGDNLIGNNNAIIYNSNYYRMVLFFGLLLAVLTILLNMIFIPIWGINGAAFASLLAFFLYNAVKIWFVKRKMALFPFSRNTVGVLFLIAGCSGVFYFWDFPFHPVINILLKSVLIAVVYLFLAYRFKLAPEVNEEINKYL
ncbi:polysaccharide biosynthesis protein [Robertkochia marina]|uniref:Polysaccharide biosynthesis protein n=1 Tax=Robertkochia marina TaxID=1227945 RepID=A0A4S3M0B6_9FLAO|nr:oligosaccharide flippase family protein [Robertkochia marina]THD67824.1 polysaccharide biosynthesis protein [Robertkochia marina]TRZ41703.1 polysaccharide biosynthesis protein [Robertkochia marina]